MKMTKKEFLNNKRASVIISLIVFTFYFSLIDIDNVNYSNSNINYRTDYKNVIYTTKNLMNDISDKDFDCYSIINNKHVKTCEINGNNVFLELDVFGENNLSISIKVDKEIIPSIIFMLSEKIINNNSAHGNII